MVGNLKESRFIGLSSDFAKVQLQVRVCNGYGCLRQHHLLELNENAIRLCDCPHGGGESGFMQTHATGST